MTTHRKNLRHLIRVTSKYLINMWKLWKHSTNNMYLSTSNWYQELSKNDDTEKESNTGDYVKPTKAVESNKTNSGKRNNSNTRKETANPIIHRHKKTQQHLKKYDNVAVILGHSMVKDLKGWELSNDKQQVVVKYFSGAERSHMHWHAKPTIEKNRKILSFIVALMT